MQQPGRRQARGPRPIAITLSIVLCLAAGCASTSGTTAPPAPSAAPVPEELAHSPPVRGDLAPILFAAPTRTELPSIDSPAPATLASDDESSSDLFHDPKDGAFDISKFLDSRTGFLPFVMPITEPAIGYGGAGALAFFETPPRAIETPDGTRVVPPNASMVGGFGTENGSWGAFGGYLHTWDDGRIRYLGAAGYASLNLDWFGRSDAFAGKSFSYNLDAVPLYQKLTFKLGDSDFFLGPTQRLLVTKTRFVNAASLPPLGISAAEEDTTVSGFGFALAYDTRNSYFSPSSGTKASLNYTQNDGIFGSDFNYGRGELEDCQYLPLGGPFTLGLRGDLQYASDNAPFFDLASVNLRGIPAGRYVDNVALTLESELRWDIIQRWTVVGFGGVGWTADELGNIYDEPGHWAGGAGFRYLMAREYDMRIGCDLAYGPDGFAFYVSVGTGWLRD
jgi:Omp85 superfamily domain